MSLQVEGQDILGLKKEADKWASLYAEHAETIAKRVIEELEQQREVAFIIFCDMSGSTRLADTQGMGQYLRSFAQFYMIIARTFANTDEKIRVLRTVGDEVLLVRWLSRERSEDVPEVLSRIACAATQAMDDLMAFDIPAKITLALCEKTASGRLLRKIMRESFSGSDEKLYKRIGIEDLWGDEVNRAARIASIARDYQVLVDQGTAEKLACTGQVFCEPPLPFYGKGITGDLLISHVVPTRGRANHLIHNYGFNAIATFQVSPVAPSRYMVDQVLRVLGQCFPGPMLAFAYKRVSWNPINPGSAGERRSERLREIEADWDLYVGLLATDYNDFTRRIFNVRQQCRDSLFRSVTSPIWDPPGSQPTGRHDYNLESGAHAFYKVDVHGNIVTDLPDLVHFSSYACARYDGAEAVWQYTRTERQDAFGDLGRATEAWITLGATDVTVLHRWPWPVEVDSVIEQDQKGRARRDVIAFPEHVEVGVTVSHFCHWVGIRCQLAQYKKGAA